jgi:hypothetical protein
MVVGQLAAPTGLAPEVGGVLALLMVAMLVQYQVSNRSHVA